MGKLAGAYDNPEDKTTMWSRQEVWDYSVEQARELGLDSLRFATTFWCDMQFGALIDALKMKGVYDDTLVILQNDHGQIAKGLLYEQGTRIINFQRYPPLFGKDGMKTLPDDFVTSNVDLAATIFQLAGAQTPSDYQMDGVSYLDDVVASLNEPDFDQVADGEGSCEYKYLDIKNSHSMVSGQYQYIFRATDSVDTMYDVDELYPNTYDLEQLYDLENDPNQKQNIFNNAPQMMAHSEIIAKFETLMRIYVDKHCISTNGAQCVKPDLRFGTSGGLYDLPTTTNNGGGGDGGSGGHDTPAPVHSGCTDECCSDDDCRGPQVCSEGVCGRPSDGREDGGGDSDCPTECCSDDDCRGPKTCESGVCQRASDGRENERPTRAPREDSGDRGSGDRGSGGRGGGRGGILEEQDVIEAVLDEEEVEAVEGEEEEETETVDEEAETAEDEEEIVEEEGEETVEENESVDEEMAFNGMISAENESGFSLQNATVNVSTLLMVFVMAMALMMGRSCFWKMYNMKKVEKTGASDYGAMSTT